MANGFGLFSCCEPHATRPPAMTNYKSDLLRLLDERGYIHQTTDAEVLDAFAAQQVVPGYIGFYVTAPSPHFGRLVPLLLLPTLQLKHARASVRGGGCPIGDD